MVSVSALTNQVAYFEKSILKCVGSDIVKYNLKAAQSVTFDILIFELMFLFFKNTVKKLKFRYNCHRNFLAKPVFGKMT